MAVQIYTFLTSATDACLCSVSPPSMPLPFAGNFKQAPLWIGPGWPVQYILLTLAAITNEHREQINVVDSCLVFVLY